MQKITLIRTGKQNSLHLSLKTLERFAERVKSETKDRLVSQLRRELPFMSTFDTKFKKMDLLPKVYPAAEWRIDERGDLAMVAWNGMVLLSIGGLTTKEQADAAKQAVRGLPSTVLAVTGSSGKTLKVLVAVASTDGRMPADEEECDTFYRTAHAFAAPIYEGATQQKVTTGQPSIRDSFRMTFDPEPYLNLKATPLKLFAPLHPSPSTFRSTSGRSQGENPQPSTLHPSKGSDFARYDEVEYLYRRVTAMVYDEMDDSTQESADCEERATAEIARRLCLLGVGEEEAFAHLRGHLWDREKEQHIRGIVAASYEMAREHKPKADPATKQIMASAKIRHDTLALIDFLNKRYQLRFNTVMGYAEYRPNHSYYHPWQPVDERAANDLAIEARTEGLNVWDKDVRRIVNSSYATRFSPIEEYLWECQGKWDGHDRIRELASTVPNQNPYWQEWFYRWFLAMVSQWRSSVYTRYGNASVPLLISKQGWNKTTFCQSLIPQELQWGYTQSSNLSDEKQTLLTMSQMLLVNLDEFNRISPRVQQGFLKNILSLPTVKARRPYGKHVEVMARLASFIATTNQTDVLSDPTGSRRFLGVELTGPIDVSHRPNHQQLYAQALDALDKGEPTWFDEAETQQIMDYNRRFQQQSPAEQFFTDCFRPASSPDEPGAEWMSASSLFQEVRNRVGSSLKVNSLLKFGRTLANMPGLQRRITRSNTQYLVVRL